MYHEDIVEAMSQWVTAARLSEILVTGKAKNLHMSWEKYVFGRMYCVVGQIQEETILCRNQDTLKVLIRLWDAVKIGKRIFYPV